jgi:hypothetical protein
MTFQSIAAGNGADIRVNDNFDAVAQSGCFGKKNPTTSGLTWGYYGGQFNGNVIADGTVALTASATNYIVALISTGVVSVSTTTTNWNNGASYVQIAKVITGTATITSWQDYRSALAIPFLGGTLGTAVNEASPVTLASAATVNIGAAAANSITISGTTTITAFDTIAAGAKRELTFQGVLTLTQNATSLILPTGANITTAAGDVADFVSLGSGNWRCVGYTRASGTALSGSPFTGGTLTGALNEAPEVTLASAATVNIGAAAANTVIVTGTTSITAFDTIATGAIRRVRFTGALTLTYNATSLILPTSANITTAAGDVATFESLGSGNWRCIGYQKVDGTPLANGALLISSQSAAYTLVLGDANTGILHPSADTTARTWTIPANASVAFPVGTAITFINQNAAGVLTIAITTDTMRLAGAGTTGSRTLAANGVATALKITSTEWIIVGGSSLT